MMPRVRISRRRFALSLGLGWLTLGGCTMPMLRTSQPVAEKPSEPKGANEVIVVRDLAGPWGLKPFKIEGIALVTGLQNTGSDPPPDPTREMLVADMLARDVRNPNAVLASPQTSMVLVRGLLPPGVRKGDRFDVEVRVPARSETTSLAGGWLMQTRLREMAVLDGALRSGEELGLAQGHVLADAQLEAASDPVALRKGVVLGGGVALKSRPLGLALRSQHQSVRNSALIATSVNRRFHIFDQANIKQGVAKPLRDNYIELEIHPRYRHNLWRYVRVVGEIPVRETATQRVERLESLAAQLLQPASAARAALKLEAIGNEGVDVLRKGLASDDQEIRFYAAEALAYLDQAEAAPVLSDLARREPAFRWHALTALAAMDEMAAYDELVELLHVESVETRYGAFRAMKERNRQDPLVKGEPLGNHCQLHVIGSDGPPLVHIARSRAPEIVIFGNDLRLTTPLVLVGASHITLKSLADGQMRISRFPPGQPDRQVICSSRLDDAVRQLVGIGATYPDVVSIIQQAKAAGKLAARVEVDAIPRPGRTYEREANARGAAAAAIKPASPLPNLFSSYDDAPDPALSSQAEGEAAAPEPAADAEGADDSTGETLPPPAESRQPWWNVFGRMGS